MTVLRPRTTHISSTFSSSLFILSTLFVNCCHGGDDQSGNHLIIFDTPPSGVSDQKPVPFDIRSNFSGSVKFVESRNFRVVVNITAPSLSKAYDVSTRFESLRYKEGMMLEVKQDVPSDSSFDPTWYLVALACAAFIVALYTAIYAIMWYRQEKTKQDKFCEHKSYASSSHRGNDIRTDEELRQVREMPEEEEAEAYEMEQLKKLKFKDDLDDLMPATTEDSDPQEKNLSKSHLHFQPKTIHKELLKKNVGKKGPAPPPPLYKRTQMGKYEGVPTNDFDDTDSNKDNTLPIRGGGRSRGGSAEKLQWPTGNDLQVLMKDDSSHNSNNSLSSFGRSLEKESNIRKSENDQLFRKGPIPIGLSPTVDSDKLVKADVHPGGQPTMVSITPRDGSLKSSRPSNIYVPTPQLRSNSTLSTFGQRSTPPPPIATKPKFMTSTNIITQPEYLNSDENPNTQLSSTPVLSQIPNQENETSLKSSTTSSSSSPSSSPLSTSTPISMNRQNASRNFNPQDNQWASPGLLSMSDIPEDPREDDQSGVSGSLKSTSMYGSSEIFDPNEAGNTYYNLDSDIDIPPLDSDDNLWSDVDGGLPSPRLWPLKLEKGKTNDDIKLIPGALKSPGPNSGKSFGLKPRPNSSITLQSEQGKPTSAKDYKRGATSQPSQNSNENFSSPSNQFPPAYEEIMYRRPGNDNPTATVFEFPPTPNMEESASFSGIQAGQKNNNGNNPQGLQGNNANGDYVVISHGSQEPSNEARGDKREGTEESKDNKKPKVQVGRRGGSGKKPVLGSMYMNMTFLATICVLSLVTSVMSVMTTQANSDHDTKVDITVYAPLHFFNNMTRVFFNEFKDTEAFGLKGTPVSVFDVWNPTIYQDGNQAWHCNHRCQQGCDETRDECICLKGYRLNSYGKCEDVNECMEGKAKCDKAAGCYNRKGTYDCICGEDYYGDGKTCRECDQECPKDHYEEQPCSPDRQKICKACTKSCPHGYYFAQSCSSHQNALCRVCQPQCGEGKFESRQCTVYHDRICSSVSDLTLPAGSSNLLLEERSQVKSDEAYLDRLPRHYVGFSHKKLSRATDFLVDVTVKFLDPTPQFVPVNLSQPYDFDLVAPSILGSYYVRRYCPSPVPDYFTLSYKKHKNLTYKLFEKGSIEACEIHKQFGQFFNGEDGTSSTLVGIGSKDNSGQTRKSFVCAQPGSLTNKFVMDEDFFHARTKWVDKSKRCQRNSRACESCTTRCGTDMFHGDPMCSIDSEGRDDGTSPRLQTCYNCCVKDKCSNDCKDYHKRRCRPEQCTKGNLLEFTLIPEFESSQDRKFFCHIKPVANQLLVNFDYYVKHKFSSTLLYSSNIKLYGNQQWKDTGKMEYSDGILNVVMDSGLDKMPNFMEGDINGDNHIFKVGSYKESGTKFKTSNIQQDFVFLRPSTPTAIPHMPQAQQDCTNHEFDSMNLASNIENPYIQDVDLRGKANGSLPLSVNHKDHESKVKVQLQRDTHLLKKLFSIVRLLPNSFHGNMQHNGSHWVIKLSGAVSNCPGYLGMQIQDPMNATRNLYDIDLVVLCPANFNLTFAFLTFDEVTMFKDVMVVIHDEVAVQHFRLYHKALNEDEFRHKKPSTPAYGTRSPIDDIQPFASKQQQSNKKAGNEDNTTTPDLPISVPSLIAIIGVIILLIVLAILGLCFLPEIPETPLVQWYHPVFAICYMIFQLVYSVCMTGCVFFLILYVITSPYVKLIHQYGEKGGSVGAASTKLNLLKHLENEIARQDLEVDLYQRQCIVDVKTIVHDMDKMHQQLLKSTSDIFDQHRLDLLLEEQKVYVRQKLTQQLEKFRDDYLKASKSMLRRVRQDAAASYQNIKHNNTWLKGARFLNQAVSLFRSAHKKQVQTFMEWTGINVDEDSLDIDLSFSLPALPRLNDIQAPPPKYKSPVKRDLEEQAANDKIRSIQIHNNWFFPINDVFTSSVFRSKKPQPETSHMIYVFLGMLAICDFILLAHRMTKAWTTARLIVFGFPEYFRERKDGEAGDDDNVFASRESKTRLSPVQSCKDSPWIYTVKLFFTQSISTTFLPKMVGAIAACVVLVCCLRASNHYLTASGLPLLGLSHSTVSGPVLNQMLRLQVKMTNHRIEDHAVHINTLDYPSFQSVTNTHLNTHKAVFAFYRKRLYGLQNLTTHMYCLHLKDIGIPSNCTELSKDQGVNSYDNLQWLQMEAMTHACRFQPVIPKLFYTDDIVKSEKQVEALLESVRYIIYLTSQLIIVFLFIIVLKELAFSTIWILLQRSGVIRVRIIVEQDQGDFSQ